MEYKYFKKSFSLKSKHLQRKFSSLLIAKEFISSKIFCLIFYSHHKDGKQLMEYKYLKKKSALSNLNIYKDNVSMD